MDNTSSTHGNLHVAVPLGLYDATSDIDFTKIVAVQIQHCKSTDRSSDRLVYVEKNDEPKIVDIGHEINGTAWEGLKYHHTTDVMRKVGAESIAISETSFTDPRRIYDSSILVVRLDAIKRIVADPEAPNTKSLIEREGAAPIPVLAPVRNLAKMPGLAKFTPPAPPVR